LLLQHFGGAYRQVCRALARLRGGLNFWPEPAPEEIGATLGWFDDLDPPGAALAGSPSPRPPLQPGRLVLHGCATPHQIAHLVPLAPNDLRITLQGHGVRTPDGAFLVYF
jgi:hypothetical protein